MSSTKKRGAGLGDNLYGIPLDDILSPEEIEQMRQRKPSENRRRRKKRHKKIQFKKFEIKNFRIPEFRFTQKSVYIICAVAALLFLFFIFKTPIAVRLTPKLYLTEALLDTTAKIEKEAARIVDGVFGFDVLDEKELTIHIDGGVGADSKEKIANMSVDAMAGYSIKGGNAAGTLQCMHGDDELASASLYLNNQEVGVSIPQLFGEYWVAAAETFGRDWNSSGLRKAIYAGTIGEDADLSFNNLFGSSRQILSHEGMDKLAKETRALISASEAVYEGKPEILVDGENKPARSFRLALASEDVKEYLTSMADIISEDENLVKYLSCSGTYEQITADFEDFKVRLADSIAINDAYIRFVEYGGSVMSASALIGYTKDGIASSFDLAVSSDSSGNLTDSVKMALNISEGDSFYTYAISSAGNHSGKGKLFTDATTITTSAPEYNYTLSSEMTLDFKSGEARGELNGSDIYGSKSLSYSGNCSQKKGLLLDLTEIWASAAGGVNRNLTGRVRIGIVPDMTLEKVHPSNKKSILDLSKAEADNYLKRLAETDIVKDFMLKTEKIFGGGEQ